MHSVICIAKSTATYHCAVTCKKKKTKQEKVPQSEVILKVNKLSEVDKLLIPPLADQSDYKIALNSPSY